MTLALAQAALAVFAVAPQALGGVRLRAAAGPERDAWLEALRAALPPSLPWRRLPLHARDEALLGGLDLSATLAAGRPVAQAGLLAQAAGGVLVSATSERMRAATAAQLAPVLDAAGLAVVALDEGADDDEAPPGALLDRLALWVRPESVPARPDAARVAAARMRWRDVQLDDVLIEAIVAAAAALGVTSARAARHALAVARISAALDWRAQGHADDAACAVRLVFAPRATQVPTEAPPRDPSRQQSTDDAHDADSIAVDQALEDRLIEAAQAAIAPDLLAMLAGGRKPGVRRGEAGRAGEHTASRQRGRVIGALRGDPRGGARLALIETLRAAAPWQRLRARGQEAPRLRITRDDLRIQRRVQRRATTTVFAIDASGSQALHRLAEAKGAVELLLTDCYARRDRVAVIGFRGAQAQVLLAPTRSLVRAKRQLAGLPGGGGTPLAAGIDAAHAMALAVRRGGASPLVVLLTDGRANIARDGTPGREAAQRDAQQAARAFAGSQTAALLIDTSPQPSPAAQALAQSLCARYLALPHAQAASLSIAIGRERGGA